MIYVTQKYQAKKWYLAYNTNKSIVSYGCICVNDVVNTGLMQPEIFTSETKLNTRKNELNIN